MGVFRGWGEGRGIKRLVWGVWYRNYPITVWFRDEKPLLGAILEGGSTPF